MQIYVWLKAFGLDLEKFDIPIFSISQYIKMEKY